MTTTDARDEELRPLYERWMAGQVSFNKARKAAGRPIRRAFGRLAGVRNWEELRALWKKQRNGAPEMHGTTQ